MCVIKLCYLIERLCLQVLEISLNAIFIYFANLRGAMVVLFRVCVSGFCNPKKLAQNQKALGRL